MAGMQFPYPRKSSHPDVYTSKRASAYTHTRRRNLRSLAAWAAGGVILLCLLLLLFRSPFARSASRLPPGTPEVVIVTTLDPSLSPQHRDNIMANRRDYAHRHGYATFFPNTTDYDLMPNTPSSWSTIPALRHAMTLHPRTPWLWYLTSSALIMNPREPLGQKLLAPRVLESHMLIDIPVVPPDSVIKTLAHLKGERVDVVLSHDSDGLAGGSLFVRAGDWAKFFLDAWYDPLYRSYNFQKAEAHALEHLVQWHGTVLAKLALVPQRLVNSYTRDVGGNSAGLYHEGDFVVNCHGCSRDPNRDCEREMAPHMNRWRELKDQERR